MLRHCECQASFRLNPFFGLTYPGVKRIKARWDMSAYFSTANSAEISSLFSTTCRTSVLVGDPQSKAAGLEQCCHLFNIQDNHQFHIVLRPAFLASTLVDLNSLVPLSMLTSLHLHGTHDCVTLPDSSTCVVMSLRIQESNPFHHSNDDDGSLEGSASIVEETLSQANGSWSRSVQPGKA